MKPSHILATCLCLASFASAQGSAIAGKAQFNSKDGDSAGLTNNSGSNFLPSNHIEGIVPKSERNRFGNMNGGTHIPFSRRSTRYQQVFDGAELPALLPVSFIAFRQDDFWANQKGQTIDVEMKLGFTTKSSTTLTTNFANNFDSGTPTLVLKRQMVKLDDFPSTNPTDPHKFFLEFKLDSPFVWTRRTGRNLLIEITVFGNKCFAYPLDAASGTTSTRLVTHRLPATTGFLDPGRALVMAFLRSSRKSIKSGSFTSYGTGCLGTRVGRCPSNNPNGGGQNNYQGTNNYAFAVDPTSDMVITGFEILTNATVARVLTINTQVYLADSKGGPCCPQRTGTMKISPGPGAFYKTTFTPLPIRANQRVFISYTGIPNKMMMPIVWTGTTSIHYCQLPTSTAWNGPVKTVRWSYRINCTGVRAIAPVLSSLRTPEIGHTHNLTLSQAKRNSSSVLILGTRKLNINLAALGAAKCTLLSGLDIILVVPTDRNGEAVVPVAIPNDRRLFGGSFFSQFGVLDTGVNAFGMVFTNGGESKIGG